MTERVSPVLRPAAGWYGKLPTVGDFATRRLDSDFVHVWDDWLSAGLASFRGEDEGFWLDTYLASPTWRFLLTPGFLPAPLQSQSWTGVVMPSVDRVGRYYPLTLASPLLEIPFDVNVQAALWSWLHRLEDVAVDALQEDWSIDSLEAELARIGLPPGRLPDRGGAGAQLPLGSRYACDVNAPPSFDTFFATCAARGPPGSVPGRCVWYSEANLLSPRLLCSSGRDDSILNLWRS